MRDKFNKNNNENLFPPEEKKVEAAAPTQPNGITIKEYLNNYPHNRNLDNIFINWILHRGANIKKSAEDWNKLFAEFLNETH